MSLKRTADVILDGAAIDLLVRRRPGDPQREQKEATRKKLLTAAHAVFERYSYVHASVDMIADAAGVSRTTYYRHFDGKLPVALALFAGLAPKLQDQWKDILSAPNPSIAEVTVWVRRQVETIEADPALSSMLRQIEAIEPDVRAHRQKYYQDLLEMMWPDQMVQAREDIEVLRARSILLLFQIDQFLYLFGTRDWEPDHGTMIAAMAELFHEFLQFRNRELASSRLQR